MGTREMKDSGLPWANIIPSTWSVTRGKRVLNLMQREVRPDDEVVTCFRDGEVILRKLRRTEGFTISDKEIGYQGINVGDIVIHGMDGFAGAMGISKSQGKGTPVYVVCTSKEDNYSPYLIYYLKCLADNNVFLALSTGIRERSCDLKWNKISVLPFICPTKAEQRRIATFLDEKCKDIDTLITLQEEMIAELQAYKQSVISEAVTKGLNPNVTMKDSGVEWIGDIPMHWNIAHLNYFVSKVGSGSTPRGGSNIYVQEGIKFLRSQNVYFEGLILNDVAYITQEIHDEMQNTKVMPGDVLLNITGGSIGRCYYVDEKLGEANVNQHVCIIRPTKLNSIYLKYFLQSNLGQTQIDRLQTGGNREGLSAAALKKFIIFEITLTEQQAIADYLDTKCSQIDELIALKQQKITELQDYKKSLIYEYVTGKKEVPDNN